MKKNKKKNVFGKRLKEAIVHLFGGMIIEDSRIPTVDSDPLEANYLFDFKKVFRTSWGDNGVVAGSWFSSNEDKANPAPEKIVIKPIDVLHELEIVPTPFSMNFMDEKLSVLRDKKELIQQKYAAREIDALIERMENRRKYEDHKIFFDQFQTTTDEKIDELLSKYQLEMHPSDIFIPEFPDEAINVMKKYTAKVEEITGKKPIFYVIAQPEHFKKVDGKRDPILLVQSPFGFYYHILGAWDAEMLCLSML